MTFEDCLSSVQLLSYEIGVVAVQLLCYQIEMVVFNYFQLLTVLDRRFGSKLEYTRYMIIFSKIMLC